MFSGLFFRDGVVFGLSRVFRSPCILLGISVDIEDLEIAGLESRSGLTMGDFLVGLSRLAGHEGRRARLGPMNVGFSAFHEGRGARKTDPPGGHDLVNRKKLF